jgi:uncharacterized protein
MNGSSKLVRASSAVRSPETRVSQYDWETLSGELSRYGCVVLEELVSPDQCRQIAALYPQEEYFRSHIHMARHGASALSSGASPMKRRRWDATVPTTTYELLSA